MRRYLPTACRMMVRSGAWWVGVMVGVGLTVLVREWPYVNWHSVAAPLDAHPLLIRHDAKGDGRYLAPRSGRRTHRGIDLAAPVGQSVRAIRSGRVVQVGTHRGLGRFIELEHRHALRSLYAHLHAVDVAAGARVRQGQVIGAVGKTGNARHPWIQSHLHLEVLKDGTPIDPQQLGLLVIDPQAHPTRHATIAQASDADGGQ